MKNIKTTIQSMLPTKLSIKELDLTNEAILELTRYKRDNSLEAIPTVSTYHYLTQNLELDEICNEFNSEESFIGQWNSEDFYGVSIHGQDYIYSIFECEGDNWNSYNWQSNFDHVMQGRTLKNIETGDEYVLLQIQQGGDVRGNYTSAKLFKVSSNCEYFMDDRCYFDKIDWSGEWINHEGSCAEDSDFEALALEYKLDEIKDDNFPTVTIVGYIAC